MGGEPADGRGFVPAVCVDGVPESGVGNEPAACVGDESGPEPEPPVVASDPGLGVPEGVPPLGADDGLAPGALAVPGVSVGDTPAVELGSGEAVGAAPGVLAA